jgi:hypothetical protein
MSEITKVWFEEAKKLEVGQAIFIRAANKKEQTSIANEFEEERDEFALLEPVHASQIFINKTLKDGRQYVVLKRMYRAPFTAFFQDVNGGFTKITVDPERRRMIQLMIRDGKSRSEIENILDGLTDDEIESFFST